MDDEVLSLSSPPEEPDKNICRLCRSRGDLLWMFNERMPGNMTEIVEVTSGVRILRSDAITQMVCGSCCQITLRMFSFRTKSIKNDKDLKTKHAQYNITQLQNQSGRFNGNFSSASSATPSPAPTSLASTSSASTSSAPTSIVTPSAPVAPKIIRFPIKYRHAHASLKTIIKKNPSLKLPEELPMKSHFSPYITLLRDEVDEWFKQNNNLSNDEISKLKSDAVERSAPKPKLLGPQSSRKRYSQDDEYQPPIKKKADESSVKIVHKAEVQPVKQRPSIEAPSKPDKDMETNEIQRKTPTVELPKEPEHKITLKKSSPKDNGDTGAQIKSTLNGISVETNKARRKQTIRKTTRPITYNEELSATLTLEKEQMALNLANGSEKPKPKHPPSMPQRKSLPKTATAITAHLADPDTDTDDTIDIITSSPSSSRSSTPSLPGLQNKDDAPAESSATGKNDFARSLALTPRKDRESITLSDLLVSHKTKSQTLHTCKICDSHFYSTKDLKVHVKKTHTKCSYCNKRFRSLAAHDEHAKECNMLNSVAPTLKTPKLELKRVDQVPDIRSKYASAFQTEEISAEAEEDETHPEPESDVPPLELVVREMEKDLTRAKSKEAVHAPAKESPNKTDTSNRIPVVNKQPPVDKVKAASPSVPPKAPTPKAAAPVNGKPQERNVVNNKTTNNAAKSSATNDKRSDVICISDDEAEKTMNLTGTGKPKLNVTYPDVLRNVNLNATDSEVLRAIVREVEKHNSDAKSVYQEALRSNPIAMGNTAKTRIFKNLRRHLFEYKIPVEISYNPDMRVSYKHYRPPPTNQVTDIWFMKAAKDIGGYVKSNNNGAQPSNTQVQMLNPTSITIPPVGYNRPSQYYRTDVTNRVNTPETAVNGSTNSDSNTSHLYRSLQQSGANVSTSVQNMLAAVTSVNNTSALTNPPIILNNSVANSLLNNYNMLINPSNARPLPSTQASPLPIIESIRSENIGIPAASSTPTPTANIPHIRVKNLQELS